MHELTATLNFIGGSVDITCGIQREDGNDASEQLGSLMSCATAHVNKSIPLLRAFVLENGTPGVDTDVEKTLDMDLGGVSATIKLALKLDSFDVNPDAVINNLMFAVGPLIMAHAAHHMLGEMAEESFQNADYTHPGMSDMFGGLPGVHVMSLGDFFGPGGMRGFSDFGG